MDFKQIEAFVNVVRYKSFSKAADATFFTQPTISTHIRNLEKELGVKLLDRKSRIVEMTPQGSKFYKYAVEMINARAQAFDALNDTSENIGGILEIQTSSIPSVTFLPDLLSGFRVTHPGIQYYVSVSDTQTVIDNITERIGEIGFIGDKISSPSIECTKVAVDKSVLIAPVNYDIPSTIKLSDAIQYPLSHLLIMTSLRLSSFPMPFNIHLYGGRRAPLHAELSNRQLLGPASKKKNSK